MNTIANFKHEQILYHQITSFVPMSHCFKKKILDITRSTVIISSKLYTIIRRGSRIWSRGGPQLLRLKVADVAKWSHTSEASNLQLGSRVCLRALEAFGFLMLKYAFSHILETLFLSFLTSILTPKVDKIEH